MLGNNRVRFARDLPRAAMKDELKKFVVEGCDEVLYIPEFITKEEENYLTRKVG